MYPGCRDAGLDLSKISKEEVTGELPLGGWPAGGKGNRERTLIPHI